MLKLVVLSGAGVSAESGLNTFRDSNGLWENYRIEDVATPEAFLLNPELVLSFYNMRRQQVLKAEPNDAHKSLEIYNNAKTKSGRTLGIQIITQNVDDLHERAGSGSVLHLHGEILKARSTTHPHLIYDWKRDITLSDRCEQGSQLRPHIVWFNEEVPLMDEAIALVQKADILLIVGTSLAVYPAAGLVHYRQELCPVYLVDPNLSEVPGVHPLYLYKEEAGHGIIKALQHIIENY